MKVSGDAEKDPKFRKVIEQLEKSAKKTRKHPPASQKASEAQKAAVSPPNERSAGAQANQVDAMKSAEAPKAEPNGFLALLRAEIEKVMPKNLDDADKFMKGNETAQVKGAVAGGVQEQKDTAAGPTEQAAGAPPDTGAVPARASEAMPAEPAEAQLPVAAGEAMPAPRPGAQVQALQQPKQDANQQMKDADLTPEQLTKANDPRFSSVLSAKSNVEKVATAAPGKYTSSEKATLGQAVAKASSDGKSSLGQMAAVKVSGNSKVKTRQLLAKQKDEARRKEVTDTIEKLYQQTKLKVETKLSSLETDVMRMFDLGAEAALSDMKSYANREIDKYKDDRYSGILGKGRWIADLFRDVPEGIKVILRAARTRFGSKMDALAVRISSTVDSRLADAKAEVNKGQAAIKSYVDSLPRDLQSVGRQAQQEMASRFDELRNGIDAKKNDLAQKLAQKYKEAHDKADAALKKLEDENKGALKGLVDAIAEVIRIIAEFKDKLMGVLRKGADAIMLILKDPIGFLGNLLAAIKLGFNQFVANIWTHLKRGFMQWLFGSLAEAGIQVPSDLNVWSILKLVLDVLGLTYAWMRGEAVKLVGERNVALIEKLVEYITVTIKGGPQALWEKLKEDLSNLKAMVIDAIQTWLIDTIVKQAVTKVVSMFNPAGAFIQACIAIYNVVMWVIENASRILALIEAVVNSIHAIATGAIGGAANWIEQALANLIPIVIGFLARLIGLGGISAKIREFITKVQTKVRAAVLGWLKKAFEWVKKLFGKGGDKGDKRTMEQKQKDVDAAVQEADALMKKKGASAKGVTAKLGSIKSKYKLTSISLAQEGENKFHVEAEINPKGKGPSERLASKGSFSLAPGGFAAHEGGKIPNIKAGAPPITVHLLANHGPDVPSATLKDRFQRQLEQFRTMRDARIKGSQDAIARANADLLDIESRPATADQKKLEKRVKDQNTQYTLIREAKENIRKLRLIRENDTEGVVGALERWGATPMPTRTSTRFYRTDLMEQSITAALEAGKATIDEQFNDDSGQSKAAGTKLSSPLRAKFTNNIGVGYKLMPDMTVVEAKNLRGVAVIIVLSDPTQRHYVVETAYPE
ncbi:hypothetical protein JGU66_25315 [Myxococcaceae bacterium JPH2]|nr:hypothetical protein [Myxococcaceae bacterium JPH2]